MKKPYARCRNIAGIPFEEYDSRVGVLLLDLVTASRYDSKNRNNLGGPQKIPYIVYSMSMFDDYGGNAPCAQ